MRKGRLIATREVALEEIEVGRRLRPVSQLAVEALKESVGEMGGILTPIVLRQHRTKGAPLTLIAGAHRLAAARDLGMATIRADVWDCNDAWAQLLEIDENLAHGDLTALDKAVFLARRKRLYEDLHPETRRGVAGALHGTCATETISVAAFARATAEATGQTERMIRYLVAAGQALGPDEVAKLRRAPNPVSLADLREIARINNTVERYEVVDRLADGRAKRAAQARKAYAAETRGTPPPPDPVDAEFQALLSAWSRARTAARRRFLDEVAPDLARLGVRHDA